MTNTLYYGNNNSINDIVFHQLQQEYHFKNIRNLIYKNIHYKETNNLFIFHSIPSIQFVEIIANLIESKPISQEKHIILIYNIENISKDFVFHFRILLERFHKNCLFIATTIKISSIESPIKSRFFLIRVPCPITRNHTILHNIKKKPNKNELHKMAYKLRDCHIKDICLDIYDITPYKKDFIKLVSNIEHLYVSSQSKNKELYIELILLEGFYPVNLSLELKKKITYK